LRNALPASRQETSRNFSHRLEGEAQPPLTFVSAILITIG